MSKQTPDICVNCNDPWSMCCCENPATSFQELSHNLKSTLAAQRTALQYCYEKLQPMQPFEDWVKEIGK